MQKSTRATSVATTIRRVTIYELTTGTAAILEPGILDAYREDVIEFQNDTAADATLLIAEDGILGGVVPLEGKILRRGGTTQFTVSLGAPTGLHEYQVLVTLRNRRQVFAIGASTPRIIVRSSSGGD